MYSVSCSSYGSKQDELIKTYYSIDNGTTWVEFSSTGILVEETTQIKFSLQYIFSGGIGSPGTATLSSTSLGMNISLNTMSSGTIDSDNYTLSKNITDITFAN